MNRTPFYLYYAGQTLRRSGRWTIFAVLCVAAGVATVVALRSLGLAITDSLLSNLREINRGDITLSTVTTGPLTFAINQGHGEENVFSGPQLDRIREMITPYGGQITAYGLYYNIQISALDYEGRGRPQFSSTFFIDPQNFALTRDIVALEPAGVPLRDLFSGGREIVVSQNLAEEQDIQVGDQVRLTGTADPFVVRGIVSTDTEANINNLGAAFFGFVYIDQTQADSLQLSGRPNFVSIALADPGDTAAIEKLGNDLWQVWRTGTILRVQTTTSLLERNQELADMLGRFIVVLGLGALLIGGVGIVNTMLVMVGRRTMEIASLKTFGLKGRQVALLFISEAFILGLAGSLLGVIIGLGLSLLVNRYGEVFLQQRLVWRLHPEAIVYGIALGMVVTMVFGVLPVLTAARIRPAIILRPNEVHLPGSSLIHALSALLVVVLVLGYITGQIIGPLFVQVLGAQRLPDPTAIGIAGVAAVLLFLGFLVAVLRVVVGVISRLPALGYVDLRLALRNLTAKRTRTATTLLALAVGMFALSSISFFGLGARQILQYQFSETLGGNVMVVPLVPSQVGRTLVDLLLAFQENIVYNTRMNALRSSLEAVDGQPIELEPGEEGSIFMPTLVRDTDHPNLRSGVLIEGRDLEPSDRGQRVIVLSNQSVVESAVRDFSLDALGITIGSTVRMEISGRRVDFEVIGIVGSTNAILPNFGGAFIPPGVVSDTAGLDFNILQVEPESVETVLQALTATPFLLGIDVTFIDSLMMRLITQLSAIPTLVGLLSLLAAAVIMANTVSLATLERRQQIGILKTIGLKRRRVLRVMLLENTLIGLLGAAMGIAISALGVSVMTGLGMGTPVLIPEEAIPMTIGLLAAAVIIAWLATFLSARFAVNERVLRVLRYE